MTRNPDTSSITFPRSHQHFMKRLTATVRQFINPFMIKAVPKVISKYLLTRLAVEEDFDGSRSYGCLDYVVYSLTYEIASGIAAYPI